MCQPRFPTARTLIAVLVLVCFQTPLVVGQDQLWIRQFGSDGRDWVYALAPDGTGGVMVAGSAGGNLGGPVPDFGPYLARYDRDGTRLWINQFGAGQGGEARAITPYGPTDYLLAGSTFGSLGGPNLGRADAWIAEFDENGNNAWITQFGSSERDIPTAITFDGSGRVFVAGWTDGDMGLPNAGLSDAWISRLDTLGNPIWTRQFGTIEADEAYAITSDGAGGAIVAGSSRGNLGGPISWTGWIARYDGNGNQLWIRQVGGSFSGASGLTSDGAGGAMLTGWASGALSDVMVAHFDGNGNQLWLTKFGSGENEQGYAIAIDGAGGVVVTGSTFGHLASPSRGGNDIWIARLDGAGTRLWARQIGTSSHDQGLAVAVDGVGGAVIGGIATGSLGGPHAGNIDAFIARYAVEPCYPDCDQSTGAGLLDIFDFLCWQGHFVNGNTYACDCDTSTGAGVCDVFDFLCFQDAFVGGCP